MLGNEYKRLLREQKLFKKNEYSNMSTAWYRIKKHANNALIDLELIGNGVPTDYQIEIFTKKNIDRLMAFLFDNTLPAHKKIELAALLVENGLSLCKNHYKYMNEDTPDTAQISIDYLDRAARICKDISYKSVSNYVATSTENENLQYLFNWKSVKREKSHIVNYLKKNFDKSIIGFTEIGHDYTIRARRNTTRSKTIIGNISSIQGQLKLRIILDDNTQRVILKINDDKNEEIFRKELISKEIDGEWIVFHKK